MRLSCKTTIQLTPDQSNIVGHMCYAAFKLWNVCNYERKNYKELNLSEYPDWHYQRKAHKDDLWYKSLPSQTAQQVCKRLDGSWKSFYKLLKTGGIENPKPPRFKHSKMEIVYDQNGFQHNGDQVRLSLPKQLMKHLTQKYNIHADYLYLKNQAFKNMNHIKQLTIYPPDEAGVSEVIVVYEVADVTEKDDNGNYLSIDLGLHNLMTCFENNNEKTFIVGREYLNICQKYDRRISKVQSQWYKEQSDKGIQYPKSSKHINRLYTKKRNSVNDYLHKITRYIVQYCKDNDINTIVIGDITGIRKDKDFGSKTNQKLHGLPYQKIYNMLQYKCELEGIRFIKLKEHYTSQCSPNAPKVTKKYAKKSQRVKRGCYKDGTKIYNADSVGAYNILRKYTDYTVSSTKKLSAPIVVKVAV